MSRWAILALPPFAPFLGPPGFGALVRVTGAYTVPRLTLAAISVAVALTLPRPRPLVQRDERPAAPEASTA